MNTIQKLMHGFIHAQHGSVVADQFTDSFEGEFAGQNENALQMIYDSLDSLHLECFRDNAAHEFMEYLEQLKEHLNA